MGPIHGKLYKLICIIIQFITNNNTTIIGGNNETETIYPLEIENYYNLTGTSGFFANNTLELYSNNIVIFTVNKTDNVDIELYLFQDSMYKFWLYYHNNKQYQETIKKLANTHIGMSSV